MTYFTMKIQGKKIKVGDDDANHDNHQPAAFTDIVVCHDFWNEAPKDLLTEIFIRHPDCRSAVRTSMVCRLWRSLISRNLQFIDRFKSHHHQHLFPWTLMLCKLDLYEHPVPTPEHARTLCQLYSDEWMFLHGKTLPANCLDFLPSPVLIRAASCSDLLLVSPGLSCTDDMYICSPITKQFVQLPAIPRPLEGTRVYEVVSKGYALVASPPSGATANSRFKVVEVPQYYECPVSTALNPEPNCVVPVALFCSESRKWEIRNFPCLGPSMWCYNTSSDIITCNGILYWLGFSYKSEKLFNLDLSEEKCGAIDIPSGDKSFAYRIGIVRAGGGVHELRLIQVLHMDKPMIIHFRVWRLNTNSNNRNDKDEDEDDDSNWFLVHDKKLKCPKSLSGQQSFVGLFVHPTNGDFLFIVWGKCVIEYNLTDATHKKIADLPEIAHWLDVTPFLMVLSSTASNLANSYL